MKQDSLLPGGSYAWDAALTKEEAIYLFSILSFFQKRSGFSVFVDLSCSRFGFHLVENKSMVQFATLPLECFRG